MLWPQKLNAVSQHLHIVSGKADGVTRLAPDRFMDESSEIREDEQYKDLINLMNYESGDLRAMEPRQSFPYKHKVNKVDIKTGRVVKSTGFYFEEVDSIWRCKVPDRAVFHKWGRCETKKANRDTQKFVMLFLARHGVQKTTFDHYPFDEFFGINEPEGLTRFLNSLTGL